MCNDDYDGTRKELSQIESAHVERQHGEHSETSKALEKLTYQKRMAKQNAIKDMEVRSHMMQEGGMEDSLSENMRNMATVSDADPEAVVNSTRADKLRKDLNATNKDGGGTFLPPPSFPPPPKAPRPSQIDKSLIPPPPRGAPSSQNRISITAPRPSSITEQESTRSPVIASQVPGPPRRYSATDPNLKPPPPKKKKDALSPAPPPPSGPPPPGARALPPGPPPPGPRMPATTPRSISVSGSNRDSMMASSSDRDSMLASPPPPPPRPSQG
jgi:hypothetical protein